MTLDLPSVSRLTLGTSGWKAAIARSGSGADPAAVLDEVLSSAGTAGSITVIDTSNNYGDGFSETLIGERLADRGGVPDGVIIATKLDRDSVTNDFSGDRMRLSIEESLERLRLTTVPLLYLHDPENISYAEAFAPGGPVDVLVELQRQGIAGAIGISGGPARMLHRYLETGLFQAVITHNRFTLVDRSAEQMIDYAVANRVAVFNAAPYGSAPLAKWPERATRYAYGPAPAEVADSIAAMGEAAERRGVPLAAAALQFSLGDARVTSTVVGINSLEQLHETQRLATLEIPSALMDELDELRPPTRFWQDPPGPGPWDDFPQRELPHL